MKLVDMKLPKKSKKELKEATKPIGMEREAYPYGLQLRFEKNEVEKIAAFKTIAAGAKVALSCIGKVIEVRTTDAEKGRDRHSVEIQIQKVGIEDQSKTKEQIFNEAIK